MKIWILNHYATNMYLDGEGRHQSLAKYFIRKGHSVDIFCANTIHGTTRVIPVPKKEFCIKQGVEGVRYVFIKTTSYINNGLNRIRNIMSYYKNIFSVAKDITKKDGQPDIIIASSVHPLALVAGLKIAKKYKIPCICEVRDLWPESLISYGFLKKSGVLTKVLLLGEKKIYEKASQLVFTMQGGRDYIIDKHWAIQNGGKIDLKKVHYINNGVDLEVFENNKNTQIYHDSEWDNFTGIKVVYTGSIRLTNHVEHIVNAAKLIKDNSNIGFFIFGDGDKKPDLQEICKRENLSNVYFKGKVEKCYIPNILANGDICITDMYSSELFNYGISPNKIFDYIAAQKPIISGLITRYDLVEEERIGITLEAINSSEIVRGIYKIHNMDKQEKECLKENLKKAAKRYDFKKLAEDYFDIIESCMD